MESSFAKPSVGPPPNPLLSLSTFFRGVTTQLATRLDDAKRFAGAALPAFLPPFASLSKRQGNIAAAAVAAAEASLNSEHVARRLCGTSVYTVSNTNNEFVLSSDPDGVKSIGLLCFRREDAEAFLAQVRSRRGEVKGGAKVVPITVDQDEIKRELADVTFEELQRARSDGSDLVYRKPKPEKKGGRANKNRPMEINSKKPVSRFREVIQAPKKMVRDPRFESLCGDLNVEGFKKRYNFIYEDKLPADKEELKKQMKKIKDPEAASELNEKMTQIDKESKSVATKRTEKDILAEHKKKEREAAKKGKQPYYLRKSEIQKQKLAEKYKELKESGKLESFIEKKRRRNAAKDHRYIPYRRPTEEGNE